jgi:hypothetical protein
MLKLKLADIEAPKLEDLSPEALRAGALLWLESGDDGARDEHLRLLAKQAKKAKSGK